MNSCTNKKYNFPHKNWLSLLNVHEKQRKKASSPTYSNLYAYAGNNPVYYTDPDGNFLLDSISAREYAQKNNLNIAATYGQACILVDYGNYLFPQPVFAIKASRPYFNPYKYKFSDLNNLQSALTSIENNKDSVHVSYDIKATVTKISKEIYQIDIKVVGYIKDSQSGEISVFANGSGVVGYAHIEEIHGFDFNSYDNEKVNNIINQALNAADFTLKIGEEK